MTRHLLICISCVSILLSCAKGAPVVDLTGDNTVANRGDVVNMNVSANSEGKIKILNVSGTLYYEVDGSSIIYTEDLGYLFESTEKEKVLTGSFSYTIPFIIGSDSLMGGDYDYIEFIAYAETSSGQASTNFTVQINP